MRAPARIFYRVMHVQIRLQLKPQPERTGSEQSFRCRGFIGRSDRQTGFSL